MKTFLTLCVSLCFSSIFFAQTLPSNRAVDWTLAGYRGQMPSFNTTLDIQSFGGVGDGLVVNDTAIQNAITALGGNSGIIEFPSGTFLFNSTINLPDSVIIRGNGATNTTFKMDLGGSGHAIRITGSSSANDTTAMRLSANKDSMVIEVNNPGLFAIGDWFQLIQNDSAYIDYTQWSWGLKKVGQIIQIDNIVGNKLYLRSPLRLDYDMVRNPYLQKMAPKNNVGIECLKIDRIDDTAPQQGSNIQFIYAVNCWVKGIESNKCTFAHIEGRHSSNLYISRSYFHHGHDYGGGGRAYGVMLQSTTNECLIENNVFEHLRHSMILQSGANGNAFAYNYSWDPYWTGSFSTNSAGDAVCHGTYPYCNLFEHNEVQNIVIDNSHGLNGPYNTFFRNHAGTYGIFMSATNSPNQNFIGNTITSTTFLQGQYTLQGTGHFEHGNNHKGTIKPTGTNTLPDISYAYTSKPDFVLPSFYSSIGTPAGLNNGTVPAEVRFNANQTFKNSCGDYTTPIVEIDTTDFTVDETVGTTTFYLKISETNQFSSTIQVDTLLSGLATADDLDTPSPTVVTFPPNDDTRLAVTIPITDDALIESTEDFMAKLLALDNCMLGADSSIVISITDNDTPTNTTKISKAKDIIKVGPNPASTELMIILPTSTKVFNYHIYTIEGKQVQVGRLDNNNNTISLLRLPKGLLILELHNEQEQFRTKFIRQ
ncbi:MAG: T9SS type A sorting domain-containing protein [Aureispira sp.]|nr:T9SS type A sorting domain-containing protein [Aureispira sp.]